MRKMILGLLAVVGVVAVVVVVGRPGQAESPVPGQTARPAQTSERGPASPLYTLEDAYLQWPLPPGGQAYASIDGKHLHRYVVEQVDIARRYRDQGHQWWGRLIGMPSDAESAQWLADKFRQTGLADVRIQPHDLEPQWVAESWEVTTTDAGKTTRLESAWPAHPSAGTPPEGLDLEAVWVGTGSDAEYLQREVRGKAVLLFSMPRPSGGGRGSAAGEGALQHAEAKGAAAIFVVSGLPGNIKEQNQNPRTNVPTFTLGKEDGMAMRDMIGKATPGSPARLKMRLAVKTVPGLKTATVWGTLPGATAETVYVTAHRDGYFDAATDNASGVATMIGLAEYYAKIPQPQRRRTLIFLGLSGHHPPPQNPSVEWLMANKADVFAKTALVLNSEHTSTLQTYLYGDSIRNANTYTAQLWYAGGARRPKLQQITVEALREFGVSMYAEPEQPAPPGSDLSMNNFWRVVPGVDSSDFNMYFHTDAETPETVPWTGLEATTRAYARIIDRVNTLELIDLQRPEEPAETRGSGPAPPRQAPYKLEDVFLQWPLPAASRVYGAIEGRRLHQYVVDLATISRRYRDQGHPQFWGRITGTSGDDETAQWLIDKFKQLGMSDAHKTPHDLDPQWMPESWEVTATGGGKSRPLTAAQPAYLTPGTTPAGLDLEPVWAGLGSEADFAGRDVRGKAVFVYSMPQPGMRKSAGPEGALKRAEEKGAAAIFEVISHPGNMKYQMYPTSTKVPTFSLGLEDGYAVREMIGQAPAGEAPRIRIRLGVKMVPGMKTGTVWATLPGASDETVYVMAHYDGWFDAATDNASGVATIVGLAEYYAKVPQAQRPRTMVFLGLSGHHNNANKSVEWLMANRDRFFAKTALVVESEHTSTIQTYLRGNEIRRTNAYTAQWWYAGGNSRPKLQEIAIKAFREFGVSTYAEPEKTAPPTDFVMLDFWRYVPGIASSDFNMYFHTDNETPETVPWTGLEATTRAYARVIDEVNKLPLEDLQRPPEFTRTQP